MTVRPHLHRLSIPARLLAATAVVAAVVAVPARNTALESRIITGPYASLLAASDDLGPAHNDSVQLTAALHDPRKPDALMAWAKHHGLAVRWHSGNPWAVVEGSADAVGAAFDVTVHDYRARHGQVFYAAREQPQVPDSLRTEVAELGRILSFTPFHDAHRWMVPSDVPGIGLGPEALLRTYDQADLDMFTTTFGLPRFAPEVVGDVATQRNGEATMDLEAIHAIAPDAKTVLINARQTLNAAGPYEKIAAMMDEAERRFPGAVWSFSIG